MNRMRIEPKILAFRASCAIAVPLHLNIRIITRNNYIFYQKQIKIIYYCNNRNH